MLGPQRFDAVQRMAAPGAADSRCCWGRIGRMPVEWSGGPLDSEQLPHRLECGAVSRAQQAVIPDLAKVVGKARRPKPANEWLCTEGAARGVRGLGSFVVEGELTIFQGEEAVIADGHAKDVGSQRLAGLRAGAHRFTRHHPGLFPDLWGDKVNHAGLSQRGAEFGAKRDGKGLDGDQEIFLGWQPMLAILG
jgi:hypothetical protein